MLPVHRAFTANDLKKRIVELEAENARLREAIDMVGGGVISVVRGAGLNESGYWARNHITGYSTIGVSLFRTPLEAVLAAMESEAKRE